MAWAVFSDEHLKAIGEMVQSGSDRVIAIVGGAFLDATLRQTLAERLRNDKDIAGKLLKVNRALGNTEPKVDMLYMLYAFEKPERNAMYGICSVRNYFAHNLAASFDSSDVKLVEGLEKMKLHEGRTHYPHHLFKRDNKEDKHKLEPINNERDKFIVNLKLCLIALMQDRVSHVTHSFEPRSEEDIRAIIKAQNESSEKGDGKGKDLPTLDT